MTIDWLVRTSVLYELFSRGDEMRKSMLLFAFRASLQSELDCQTPETKDILEWHYLRNTVLKGLIRSRQILRPSIAKCSETSDSCGKCPPSTTFYRTEIVTFIFVPLVLTLCKGRPFTDWQRGSETPRTGLVLARRPWACGLAHLGLSSFSVEWNRNSPSSKNCKED